VTVCDREGGKEPVASHVEDVFVIHIDIMKSEIESHAELSVATDAF